LNILLHLSALTYYVHPPPLVKHVNGILCFFIKLSAYRVLGIGILPLTSTPSMSETIIGSFFLIELNILYYRY
jgi:hypothetical protein